MKDDIGEVCFCMLRALMILGALIWHLVPVGKTLKSRSVRNGLKELDLMIPHILAEIHYLLQYLSVPSAIIFLNLNVVRI